jgi:predicted transcriptional regulator
MIDMKLAQSMGGDPADRKEASYWPTHEDAPEDIFLERLAELARASGEPVPALVGKMAAQAFLAASKETDNDSTRHAQREAIVQFLQQAREASACPDLQYFVACWMAAFEMEDRDEDRTQTTIAKQFNVTRAAVSKRVIEIRKAANPGTIARSQKSIAARKTYALRQLIVGGTRTKINLTTTQKETADIWAQN